MKVARRLERSWRGWNRWKGPSRGSSSAPAVLAPTKTFQTVRRRNLSRVAVRFTIDE